ncbi:MAG: hypothetical protein JNM94_12450 [Phycisphaerae bacterium]|nr:hypothetical protein [Phycisphaerae bacterium]
MAPPSLARDNRGALHLVLIGPRAAGKTTVGRHLAARRRCLFLDLDDCVLRRFGAESVREVFERAGERVWRQGEHDALAALLDAPLAPAVIALGGGAPMTDSIARRLHEDRVQGRVVVVHLACPAAVSATRLTREPGDRPSLTGRPITDELESLAAIRTPRYEQLADVTVDATRETDAIVDEIVAAARRFDVA